MFSLKYKFYNTQKKLLLLKNFCTKEILLELYPSSWRIVKNQWNSKDCCCAIVGFAWDIADIGIIGGTAAIGRIPYKK